MGLLSFFKGLFNKQNAQGSNAPEQIKVAPVVTPDPVVVDNEQIAEAEKPVKKRGPKSASKTVAKKTISIEKKKA